MSAPGNLWEHPLAYVEAGKEPLRHVPGARGSLAPCSANFANVREHRDREGVGCCAAATWDAPTPATWVIGQLPNGWPLVTENSHNPCLGSTFENHLWKAPPYFCLFTVFYSYLYFLLLLRLVSFYFSLLLILLKNVYLTI